MARAGCGRLVLFAGPPGSGRTALLDRARARATAHRLTVLAAGGEAGERDFPLAVARRLIEPAERYDALLELTRRLAAAAPALVTVDDLHLCDVASLDWLAFVARRLRRHGIALVAGIDARETALIGTLEETGARVLRAAPAQRAGGRHRAARRARARRPSRATATARPAAIPCSCASSRDPACGSRQAVARFVDRRSRRTRARSPRRSHCSATRATLHEAAALARLGRRRGGRGRGRTARRRG